MPMQCKCLDSGRLEIDRFVLRPNGWLSFLSNFLVPYEATPSYGLFFGGVHQVDCNITLCSSGASPIYLSPGSAATGASATCRTKLSLVKLLNSKLLKALSHSSSIPRKEKAIVIMLFLLGFIFVSLVGC